MKKMHDKAASDREKQSDRDVKRIRGSVKLPLMELKKLADMVLDWLVMKLTKLVVRLHAETRGVGRALFVVRVHCMLWFNALCDAVMR